MYTNLSITFFRINLVPRSEYPLFMGFFCGCGGAEEGAAGCSGNVRVTGEFGSEHCLSATTLRALAANGDIAGAVAPPPPSVLLVIPRDALLSS